MTESLFMLSFKSRRESRVLEVVFVVDLTILSLHYLISSLRVSNKLNSSRFRILGVLQDTAFPFIRDKSIPLPE
jgi:hypothetical protein